MSKQDTLRELVRLAKKNNDWLFYKDLAEAINISNNSFYNWLTNGSYELSNKKYKQLQDLVIDLAEN